MHNEFLTDAVWKQNPQMDQKPNVADPEEHQSQEGESVPNQEQLGSFFAVTLDNL